MSWDIEYIDQFWVWWQGLAENQQNAAVAGVGLLMEHSPDLH